MLKSGTDQPCADDMMRPFGRGSDTWLKRAADAIDGESTQAGEMAARSFLRRQVSGIDVIGSEGERWALRGGGRGQDGEAHGFVRTEAADRREAPVTRGPGQRGAAPLGGACQAVRKTRAPAICSWVQPEGTGASWRRG